MMDKIDNIPLKTGGIWDESYKEPRKPSKLTIVDILGSWTKGKQISTVTYTTGKVEYLLSERIDGNKTNILLSPEVGKQVIFDLRLIEVKDLLDPIMFSRYVTKVRLKEEISMLNDDINVLIDNIAIKKSRRDELIKILDSK